MKRCAATRRGPVRLPAYARHFAVPAAATAVLLLAVTADAQPGPGADMAEDTVPITLEQAIYLALTNNLDISLQREAVVSADAGVLQAKGQFDPTVSAGYTQGEDNRTLEAESSVAAGGLEAVRTESQSARLSVGGQVPLSTRYNARVENTASADTFNDFNDEHVSRASVTLTQPLLEGRGHEVTTTGLRVARRNLHVSWLNFRIQVETVVQEVELAYWDLIRARRDLEVRQKSVEAAETLLAHVRAKVEVGTAAEEEQVQSESGLAQRMIARIEAQRSLELRDRILKDLIVRDLVAARARLEPVDEEVVEPTIPPYEEVLREALTERPELDRARTLIAGAEDDLNLTRNTALPQLDLEASYGVNGLGGSFGDSLENGREGDNNAWSIGVVYTKPWPDRDSRGALRQQESAVRQQRLQAEQEQRRIVLEVGEVYDRLRSSADQITASEAAVTYAKKVLENERVRFDVQKATVYDLLLRETDLMEAALSLFQATADFRKNRANLYRVRGALLDRWGIELVRDTPTTHYPEEANLNDAPPSP